MPLAVSIAAASEITVYDAIYVAHGQNSPDENAYGG